MLPLRSAGCCKRWSGMTPSSVSSPWQLLPGCLLQTCRAVQLTTAARMGHLLACVASPRVPTHKDHHTWPDVVLLQQAACTLVTVGCLGRHVLLQSWELELLHPAVLLSEADQTVHTVAKPSLVQSNDKQEARYHTPCTGWCECAAQTYILGVQHCLGLCRPPAGGHQAVPACLQRGPCPQTPSTAGARTLMVQSTRTQPSSSCTAQLPPSCWLFWQPPARRCPLCQSCCWPSQRQVSLACYKGVWAPGRLLHWPLPATTFEMPIPVQLMLLVMCGGCTHKCLA